MRTLAHLAARIFNVPLLVEPKKLEVIIAALSGRMGLPSHLEFVRPPEVSAAQYDSTSPRTRRPYALVDGIAEISIIGPLVQRSGMIDAASAPLQSYEDLSNQIALALADSEVNGILLRIDSPGGEVAGCFDLVDQIHAARNVIPVVAFAEDIALSAGYALASAADEVYTTQTGYVGSVGVVTTHVDYSGALARDGIVVTHIHAGSRKVDGSPYMPLSEEARAELEGFIAHDFAIFVEKVARGRGLGHEAIRATEARVFTGEQALENDFADGIGTLDEVRGRVLALANETQRAQEGAAR